METLRESTSALFTRTPERESVNLPIEEDKVQEHVSRLSADNAAESDSQHPLAHSITISNRFARNFTDPLFPCKTVPYCKIKRLFDILVALVMLILASPVMIVTAILIKLTSRGPIIFKQIRVGQGGRHFWCYKFRSMVVDAEAQRQHLMHLNEATGPVFKIKCDPRVTRVGAIIRRYSIDELPQLFNVLRGDMSIVGPRPPLPCEVECYSPRERGRLAVRPGLTCLWQIGGRSSLNFDRWVELDLFYIETMSFANDIKIVLKTIPAVLSGSGAH